MRLFGSAKPKRIKLDDFDRELVPNDLYDIHKQLRDAGHQALLVGGCVRDYLLGLTPKDFDSATDARPERIKRVISRSRIIGRRFLLVHARRGRAVYELATFRRTPRKNAKEHASFTEENTYGNLPQDAQRRDFTINALYLDLRTNEVIDYVNGLEDLEMRQLRSVGPADQRFQEDPVRILRAIRFSAKCDFTIDQEIVTAIEDHKSLLRKVSRSRMRDELVKLFLTGHGHRAYQLMQEFNVMPFVFPQHQGADELIEHAMIESDERFGAGEKLSPAYLFAILLWSFYANRLEKLKVEHGKTANAYFLRQNAFLETINAARLHVNITHMAKEFMFSIFNLQVRLENKRYVKRTLDNQYVRAAIHLLALRSKVGEVDAKLVDWWQSRQPARGTSSAARRPRRNQGRPFRRPRRRANG